MKFNKVAVLGNPPYNSNSNGKDSTPLYHLFVESVIDNIKPDYFSMIIPSRWMNGGKGLEEFRNRMMNDRRIKQIVHFNDPFEVFPSVEINGGVNYFAYEKEYTGKCTFIANGVSLDRYLNDYDLIIKDNNAVGIVNKVLATSVNWVSDVCISRKPFGLATNFADFSDTGVKCVCKGQEINYVRSELFTDKHEIINKWKVCIGNVDNIHRSNHVYTKGSPFIIEPNAICTENYIVVNTFDNELNATNFVSYATTKFFRFLLNLRMATITISKDKFAFVPDMLDYSAPWTDAELYKKFNLTRQEVAYIESKIKAI